MTEVEKQDQNVTNASEDKPGGKVEPTATAPEKTGGKTYTEAELEQIIKDRLERAQKKADQQAEKARLDAEAEAAKKNGEWQKLAEQREKELSDLNKAIAERDAQIKARELVDLKRAIAEKVGLPVALATRLVGEDEKALETDAKALLETLPKPPAPAPAQKAQPGIVPANPGANGQVGETRTQKNARIFGSPSDPFDPAFAASHGGGAFVVEGKTGKE